MSAQAERDLEAAIIAHATDEGWLSADDLGLGDWIFTAHIPTIEGTGNYLTMMSRGTLPNHTALGLHAVQGERLADTDE